MTLMFSQPPGEATTAEIEAHLARMEALPETVLNRGDLIAEAVTDQLAVQEF